MKIRKIDIAEIVGFKLGNAESMDEGTGCTVIICEEGATGGVDVRGGAPATRETDLLKSENTVNSVNAVIISGGSAFGLEAASGVMRELSERGIGFDTGYAKVPIVCGASLYDLGVGSCTAFPDIEMGRASVRNAYEGIFDHGNKGAGTGASVGKSLGMSRAMKCGLGTFACADDHVQVGAVVAVNAVGDIYNGAGNIIAGLRTEEGSSIYGTIKSLKTLVQKTGHETPSDTVINADAEDNEIRFDHNIKNKNEIAEAIRNAFMTKREAPEEGSLTEDVHTDAAEDEYKVTESAALEFRFEEVGRYSEYLQEQDAEPEPEPEPEPETDIEPESVCVPETETNVEPEAVPEPEVIALPDQDQGYDIQFNTTIACLITNAKMSKAQANKLSSILHDAYARAIKPVHSTMDGDTVFVLTTGTEEVNFDAFAALATDVMQYAIIDAAASAETAYGLPAASDIIR